MLLPRDYAYFREHPFHALGHTEASRRAVGALPQILVEALSAASLVPLVQPQGAEMRVRIVRAGCPQTAGGVSAARPGVHSVVRGGPRRSFPTAEERDGGQDDLGIRTPT